MITLLHFVCFSWSSQTKQKQVAVCFCFREQDEEVKSVELPHHRDTDSLDGNDNTVFSLSDIIHKYTLKHWKYPLFLSDVCIFRLTTVVDSVSVRKMLKSSELWKKTRKVSLDLSEEVYISISALCTLKKWALIMSSSICLTIQHSSLDFRFLAVKLKETLPHLPVEAVLVRPRNLLPGKRPDVLSVPLPVCICSACRLQAPSPWGPLQAGVCALLLGVHLSVWGDQTGEVFCMNMSVHDYRRQKQNEQFEAANSSRSQSHQLSL